VTHTLKLHRHVEKQLRRLPASQQERVIETMRALQAEPYPHGCEHLQDALYRVRTGEHRIVYAVVEDDVIVVVCRSRRRAEKSYQHLEKLLDQALQEIVS